MIFFSIFDTNPEGRKFMVWNKLINLPRITRNIRKFTYFKKKLPTGILPDQTPNKEWFFNAILHVSGG